MRVSIRTKVLLTLTVSLVILFAVIMYLLVTTNVRQLRSSLNEESKSFASLATTPIGNTFELFQDSGTIRINQQVNNFLALDPDVTDVRIVTTDGTELFSSQNHGNSSITPDEAASFQPVYKYAKGGYINQIIEPLFEASGVHRYAIVYDISSNRAEKNVGNVVRLIFYIGIGILLISSVVTGFLINRLFLKPLHKLSQSANIISAGNYQQQIISHHHDEIGDLATSVNTMAESLESDIVKLKELDKLKSEFMMIASHNLRTPISVIRGYLDMAEQSQSPTELKAIIKTINESVTRLHLMAEDVLTISTIESGAAPPRTPTLIKPFLNSIGEEFALLAQKQNLKWQFNNEVPDNFQMAISQSNLRSALAGIIDNALKFTKDGGAVNIGAKLKDDQLLFSVQDTGIGIAPQEMPKLFTKFHRGTSTLTYDYEGVGIGLYLSKLIISQHGGQITIDSHQNQGTTCSVSIPIVGSSGPTS